MMKRQLLQHKKGVEEVVGYALLIVIALGIGTLVYYYLEGFTPKATAECPSGVSIMIKNAVCNKNGGTISLELTNTGTFTIYSYSARMSESGKQTGYGFFDPRSVANPEKNIKPGETKSELFSGVGFPSWVQSGSDYIIEIQPIFAVRDDSNAAAVCEQSIVKQTVRC